MKLIFDNTDEKHLKAIAFIKRKRDNRVVYITTKINFSTLADKEQWLITWDLRSFSDERNSAGLNEASWSSTVPSQNAEINREWVSTGDFSFQRDTIGGWLKICARLGYCSMICQCFMRIVLRFGVAELQVVTNGKMSFVFCYEEPQCSVGELNFSSSYCVIVRVRIVSSEKNCCWWLTFRQPERKSSSQSSE